ncbi:oxysterol-binding protein 2-like [Coccinella septempunctata]|uniref:oxysterol-binding protein 2-like n=1 Tax=Coccinella septempunctata TaxID=41139 RepID=UPI001D087B56|nr:oxysterol-binding protein 2-like [Coccinella septempunctata]
MESDEIGKPLEQTTSSIHSLIRKITPSPCTSQRSSTSSRRERIPDKPRSGSLSLWGFLKNCIGKDLSQISQPINFSEPLSLLQRLTEELEYSELLDKAASCSCPYEQLAYLAVFIVAGYSGCTRITKPFNPLLGETFEFDRTADLGWRVISEQISHHPPVAAHHCEGKGWILWQEFTFETRFTGNDIQVTPCGEANVEFQEGNCFKWNKIITTVHNFLIGSSWVDHQGVVEVIGKNNTEGIICNLDFIPYGGSSLRRIIKSEMRRVKGQVSDANGVTKWKIEGNCDEEVRITAVLSEEKETMILDEPRIAWKSNVLPEGSENYYSFSKFACQLNEPEDGVAPTDSRLRPDQRFMEEGKWDEANQEKTRLEEKQRRVIRERLELEDEEMKYYHPIWFHPFLKEDGSRIHKFNGNYWKSKEQQDWSKCPDIF